MPNAPALFGGSGRPAFRGLVQQRKNSSAHREKAGAEMTYGSQPVGDKPMVVERCRMPTEGGDGWPPGVESWIRDACLDLGRMSGDFTRPDGKLSEPALR